MDHFLWQWKLDKWKTKKVFGSSWKYIYWGKKNKKIRLKGKTNLDILREIKLVVHDTRHNNFLTNLSEWEVFGNKERGRPKNTYLQDVQITIGFGHYKELTRAAGEWEKQLQQQGISFRAWTNSTGQIMNIWENLHVFLTPTTQH